MGRDSARPSSRNLELLDVLFDFVNEACRGGAVQDPMVEGEREGNYFRRFVLLSIRNDFVVSGAHKQGAD